RNARLFVGHSERFNPVVQELARRLGDEEIVRIDLCRAGPSTSGRTHQGSILLNLGVHDIDLAAYLGRSTVRLRSAEGNEARAPLAVSVGGGAVATIRVDRLADTRRRTVRVTTGTHIYEGDLLGGRLARISHRTGVRFDLPIDRATEPLALQAY